jgi:hypothetical protein
MIAIPTERLREDLSPDPTLAQRCDSRGAPMIYRVSFQWPGQRESPRALETPATSADDLADRVLAHIRPRLLAMREPPRPLQIFVDLDHDSGVIQAAGLPIGWFTIERRS